MNRCIEVLKTLGFSDKEFVDVEDKLDQFEENDLIDSIKDMGLAMKKNLLKAMEDIAGSDGVDDSEVEFINIVRGIIKN
jgi:hypothetical protein